MVVARRRQRTLRCCLAEQTFYRISPRRLAPLCLVETRALATRGFALPFSLCRHGLCLFVTRRSRTTTPCSTRTYRRLVTANCGSIRDRGECTLVLCRQTALAVQSRVRLSALADQREHRRRLVAMAHPAHHRHRLLAAAPPPVDEGVHLRRGLVRARLVPGARVCQHLLFPLLVRRRPLRLPGRYAIYRARRRRVRFRRETPADSGSYVRDRDPHLPHAYVPPLRSLPR